MLRYGLIGAGRMGRHHYSILSRLTRCTLAGVSDPSSEVRDFVTADNIPYFKDYKELLDHVDVVSVATPSPTHYNIIREALLAGKHVLAEKPLCLSINEARELLAIASDKNLTLLTGHVERYNGAIMEISRLIDNPYLIETRRVGPFVNSVGGDSIVLDLMIHDIDLVVDMINSPVVGVSAHGTVVPGRSAADAVAATLQFESGAVANMVVSRLTEKKDRSMLISQKDSYILLDYTTQDINIYKGAASSHMYGREEMTYRSEYTQERLFVYKANPLKSEIMHFLDLVEGVADYKIAPERDLDTLAIALQIDEIVRNQWSAKNPK